MKKVVFILLALFVIASVSVGCSSSDFDLRQTVEAYNDSVIQLYMTGSSDRLRLVASPTEQRRISDIFANMQAEGKLMESNLENIEFVEINKPDKGIAAVKTKETWAYRVFNQNEDPNGDFVKVNYDVTYNLSEKKQNLKRSAGDNDQKWLVDTVTVIGEQKH
jgi:hypothetical protein